MLFTSEQVSCGHPDKICDQISDKIVTECLKQDKHSRCAIETLIKDYNIVLAGELTTNAILDYDKLVREVLTDIGLENVDKYIIEVYIGKQSVDIALGTNDEVGGAGDQGMMFGYATNETPEMLPIPYVLATKSLIKLKEKNYPFLRPDAKAQVTFDYDKNRIDTFLISTQHIETIDNATIHKVVTDVMIETAKEYGFNTDFRILINPTGRFVIGSSFGDSGLCLNENTLISTTKGLKKIKDLKINDVVYTESDKAKIINHFNNGEKETRIIKDENNITIEATLNHPFRVFDGENIVWKHCGDLTINDILLKKKTTNLTPKIKKIKPFTYSKNNKEISIAFDEDFCYLLGWLIGDGNTTANDRITFYYGSNEEKEQLLNQLEKCFPKEEIKNYTYQDDRFYILSKDLVKKIQEIGILNKTARQKEIPNIILTSCNKNKYAFLAGLLDSDGFVKDNEGRNQEYLSVLFTTTSECLAQQISCLLYSMGIHSTIDRRLTPNHYKKDGTLIKSNGYAYNVRLTGLLSIRQFVLNCKSRLYNKEQILNNKEFNQRWEVRDSNVYYVSSLIRKILFLNNKKHKKYFENYGSLSNVKNNRGYFRESVDYLLDMFAEYYEDENYKKLKYIYENFETVKIKTIKKSKSITYDITLDDETHSFIANGFVVHNTGRKIIADTYGGMCHHGGGAFCVDSETEYLTPNGFKKINEYDGELVAQWNNGNLEFVKPYAYIKTPSDKMYHIYSSHSIDMVLSENHDVVLKTSKGNLIKKQVKHLVDNNQLKNGSFGYIPMYFRYQKSETNCSLTDDEIRIQVAFCADGSIKKGNTKSRIRLKKENKILRLRSLLNKSNIPYKETVLKDGYSYFYFNPPILSKSLKDCFTNCNTKQFKVIAEEVQKWDGCEKTFRTTIKEDADFIQFVFMCVYNKSVSIHTNNRIGQKQIINNKEYIRKCILYEVYIKEFTQTEIKNSTKGKNKIFVKNFIPQDKMMYCFSVPSGMLILRRNNTVFVTGNSGKDSTKVDRSAAYMCRYVAKDIIKRNLASKCEIQVAYAIGVKEPVSIYVNTFGTGIMLDSELEDLIKKEYDFTPQGIIKTLDLYNVDYYKDTASYGHFGKDNLPWE